MGLVRNFAGWIKASTFGLGRRLTVVFGLMITMLVAIMILVNVHVQHQLLSEQQDLRAGHLSTLASELSIPMLLSSRTADLEVIYEELLAQPDVDTVRLIDSQGWLLASGSPDDPFLATITDPIVQRALETRQTQTTRHLHDLHMATPIVIGDELYGVIQIDMNYDELATKFRHLAERNLIIGAVLVGLGALFSGLLASRLTQPLDQLTVATRKVASGDLTHKIDLRSNDEIQSLAESFNTMVENLQDSLRQVHKVAYEDKLTGIPNRTWLNHQLERLTLTHALDGDSFAVMFLDLDKFKNINDSHGHHIGDLLLKAFAKRLEDTMQSLDLTVLTVSGEELAAAKLGNDEAMLARLGGDEFTIVAPTHRTDELARSIIARMGEAFSLEGRSIQTSTSVGIALYPDHGVTREQLLKCADVAMYQAKGAGRNRHAVYDHTSHAQVQARAEMEKDLLRALEYDQFELYLQPQFLVEDNSVIGAEALIRWQHPEQGLLSPGNFLPIAASAGLLPRIGQFMLSRAIQAAEQVNRDREKPLTIAVNVAIEELAMDGFADNVASLLYQYGAQASDLEIEVTEGTAMDEGTVVEQQVAKLRALGVHLAIDDFGMGYSNLGRLKALAFNTLKIDRSLILGIGEDDASENLLLSILEMAEAIGTDVVAEGIETDAQRTYLKGTNCKYYQGFLGGRPMPVKTFEAWLKTVDAPQPLRLVS